jgi:hypothetical protein
MHPNHALLRQFIGRLAKQPRTYYQVVLPPEPSGWPWINSLFLDRFVHHHSPMTAEHRRRVAAFLRNSIEVLHCETDDALPLLRRRKKSSRTQHKDYSRPSSYLRYGSTGPAETGESDDILTGWPADQLIRYAAGLRYEHGAEPGWIVDPLPLGLSHFLLRGARIAGRVVDISWRRYRDGSPCDTFRVYLDGECVHERKRPGHWRLPL